MTGVQTCALPISQERLGEVEWEVHHVLLDSKALYRLFVFSFSHYGRRLASWKPLLNNKTRARKVCVQCLPRNSVQFTDWAAASEAILG